MCNSIFREENKQPFLLLSKFIFMKGGFLQSLFFKHSHNLMKRSASVKFSFQQFIFCGTLKILF